MKLVELLLKCVVKHPECQARVNFSAEHAKDIADFLSSKDDQGHYRQTKPVDVFHIEGRYILADGYHREEGHRLARPPRKTILCKVHTGTLRDAILFAAGANRDHGLRRTTADKRRSVLMLLTDDEWGDRVLWPNARVAAHCGVSPSFVADMRKELAKARGEDDEEDEIETSEVEKKVAGGKRPGKSQKPKSGKSKAKQKARLINKIAGRRRVTTKKFRDMTAEEQARAVAEEREKYRPEWERDGKEGLETAERSYANLGEPYGAVLAPVREALGELREIEKVQAEEREMAKVSA